MTVAAISYTQSESGRYRVELARSFERRQFVYKPGTAITVNEALLEEMIQAEVVASVVSAD